MPKPVDSSAERLELALRAAHLGPWEWDARTDAVHLSDRAAEIVGVPPGTAMTWAAMAEHLVVEDRDRVRAAVVKAVVERADYDVEYRVNRPDGRILWLAASGRMEYAADGTPVQMLGLLQDITARKQIELDLARERRALDDFLAMLAHELRNPLAAVSNAVQLLAMSRPGEPPFERALAIAKRQIVHQTRLIDDLLDVSRIARGKIQLALARLDLAELALHTAEDHRDGIVRAGVRLVIEVPDAPVPVDGDRLRLTQVLGNLLDNARKFTRSGGEIRIRVTVSPPHAVITVTDTGIGIEADALPTLFSPFTQVERTLARSQGGLGLGLAVVRGIAELHPGGSIAARSAGLGFGAEFRLELVLADPAASAT